MHCSRKLCCFIVFILLCIKHFSLQAQEVDPLTGRLQFGVPLGQLQALDVAIPISINNHGGASRVPEGSGSCGMGWSLTAGGAVTRIVRGLPDDYSVTSDGRKGWLLDSNATSVNGFTPSGDDDLSVCTDEINDWNYLEGRGYAKDTEPDIYYINAPGINAQFIFGTDGNPKLLIHQDIQITVAKDGNQVITGFTVKNNKGLTYTFTMREDISRKAVKWNQTMPTYFLTEYSQYSTELTFTAAWLLTGVQSTATGTSAAFSYTNGEEAVGSRFVTRIKQTAINAVDTLYYMMDRVTPRLLSQIALKDYQANFTWNNGLVTRVAFDAGSSGSDVMEYDFVYVSMHSATDLSEAKSLKIISERNQASS